MPHVRLLGKRSLAPLPPPNNEFLLVEHIDVLIAALIGFLALSQLPRALARARKKSEWSQGHFLQYKSRNGQMLEGDDAIPIKESLSSEPMSSTTSEGHAFYNHSDRRGLLKSKGVTQPTYPPHIPTYPAFLRPLAERLSISVVPGYSNTQVLVMLAYLGILLYAFSYHSNFLDNPRRSGILAASQLPFLYAFASKNSVPGSLLGIGYQGVRIFCISSMGSELTCILAELFPSLCWLPCCTCSQRPCYWLVYVLNFFYLFYIMIFAVYQWTVLGKISMELQSTSNKWGLVTLTCMDVIFVFSRPIVRARAYNIFRMTHIVGYLLIVPAVSAFIHVLYLLNSYCTSCTRIIHLLSHLLSRFRLSTFWIAYFAWSRRASQLPLSVRCRPFLQRVS